MPRLLIVEDQKKLLHSLQRGLEEKGYEVIASQTGEQGYYTASTEPIDAMILDLMLPGATVFACSATFEPMDSPGPS